MDTEEVILAVVYKKNGMIGIRHPNKFDVQSYELYGFLKIYLELLEENLYYDLGEDIGEE